MAASHNHNIIIGRQTIFSAAAVSLADYYCTNELRLPHKKGVA
jgi:hypothetical protein